MPTDIRIEWHEKDVKIRLQLSELSSKRKGNIPKATRMPDPGDAKVHDVDGHIILRRTPR